MHHLSVDIETYSSVPIGKAGMYKYAQSPDFEILLIAYALDWGPVKVVDLTAGETLPENIRRHLTDPGTIKHAYNAAFEWYCLSRWLGLGARWDGVVSPEAWLPQWQDTMLHGLYCGYTAGLGITGKALGLPEDKRKLMTGKALIKLFCTPTKPTARNGGRTRTRPQHEPEKWALFMEYNRQDVVTEMEIERRLSPWPVPEEVQRQWVTDQIINARGVGVDLDLARGAIACDEEVKDTLTREAREITGLDNPNSAPQLGGWLAGQGVETPNLQKQTVEELLNGELPEDCRRVLEIRQELNKTSTAKYTAMITAAGEDSRARGLLQFYGANRTGRWAGRLVQVQNLPQTHLRALDTARTLTRQANAGALGLLYGSVPSALSQLVRTAFVPQRDRVYVDADFSAIEARVISWLAGETWRLEVFRTHGKIYEASASQMFGVPLDKIVKGRPEYALRQKGKVAELALGYNGGPGALIAMGALRMGLKEEELPEIVQRWRGANPRVCELWYALDAAATRTVETGEMTSTHGLTLAMESDQGTDQYFLTITLPSGRKLFYCRPTLGVNRWGRPSIQYWGINQTSRQWMQLETYGGKLAENCLGGNTLVLTPDGWKRLDCMTTKDKVWDGQQWVAHEGLLNQGEQLVIDVDGVRMTPDHKIYTESGWKCASSSKRYFRHEAKLPDCHSLCRVGREEITMGCSVRLRKGIHHACNRIFEGKTKVVRVYATQTDRRRASYASALHSPNVPRVEVYERALSSANGTGLEELRRPWNQSVRPMVGEFRKFLGRYVPKLSPWAIAGQNRRGWGLLPGKLSVGNGQSTGEEQTQYPPCRYSTRDNAPIRSSRKIRHWRDYLMLQSEARCSGRYVVHKTGCYEQVYDLKNCGPNHQFTVLSEAGPMLVHNCVQAIARDCLALAIERLEAAGYPVVFHIHDEVVIETTPGRADLDEVCRIMSEPIGWAPGLPLKADGWVGKYFTKD